MGCEVTWGSISWVYISPTYCHWPGLVQLCIFCTWLATKVWRRIASLFEFDLFCLRRNSIMLIFNNNYIFWQSQWLAWSSSGTLGRIRRRTYQPWTSRKSWTCAFSWKSAVKFIDDVFWALTAWVTCSWNRSRVWSSHNVWELSYSFDCSFCNSDNFILLRIVPRGARCTSRHIEQGWAMAYGICNVVWDLLRNSCTGKK